MSLLLEALKKAELAKQIAKAESPGTDPAGGESAPPEPGPRVITREKLPDIRQPLEILTDDLPSAEQKAAEPPAPRSELSLQEPVAFDTAPPAPPTGGQPGARAQAEQLFQVKEMDYNPRRPFYLTLGALGVAAVVYVGYAWWQMQPKYSFSPPTAQAVPSAPVQVAATPAQTPAQPAAVAPAPSPAAAAPAASAAVATIAPIQPVRPRQRPQGQAARAPAPGPAAPVTGISSAPDTGQPGGPYSINAPVVAVDPAVEQGYQAFQRNDLAAARDSYSRALAREPNNRDALLGLAAIDVRRGELESAESRYLKLLEMDPRNSQAVAGLVSLRGRLDPVASESRLKTLIQNNPDAAPLHFSLGNQYALQSRWAEAQTAYFKAYSVDPENADFAFNLAVSLDQLRQKKSALEYYQRALALADKRVPSFDTSQVRQRVQELSK